jgi:hypothetical protein
MLGAGSGALFPINQEEQLGIGQLTCAAFGYVLLTSATPTNHARWKARE